VRRAAGRDHDHALEPEVADRAVDQLEVPVVRRVEGAAE
jgi:hypothetical protein